jgi:hypothetical protein
MDFETLRVDHYPIDNDLLDAGTVGPELAHLSQVYRHSPRALVWRNPSRDWKLFVLLLPLGSRLSLIGNPIFSQLARAWGLNMRFIGVDAEHHVYDFRALLSDRALKLLVSALGQDQTRSNRPPADHAQIDDALDVLFEALASDLLTVLDARRDDWGRHLVVDSRLEPEAPGSLFNRDQRLPDYLAKLREALRLDLIDIELYGKVLRAMDLRERTIEQRIAAMIEACLDRTIVLKLAKAQVGTHLGCYNWLLMSPRHAMARQHCLGRLPFLATYFAEALVPLEAMLNAPQAEHHGLDLEEQLNQAEASTDFHQIPTYDIKSLAARQNTSHSLRWSDTLRRAIDAGQDRAIIEALAQRFAVPDNIIRRLWRETPAALGTPPTWHLTQILRQLQQRDATLWPATPPDWQALMAQAIPDEAA